MLFEVWGGTRQRCGNEASPSVQAIEARLALGGSPPATPTALPADTSCLPTVLNPEYRHAVIAYEVSSPADATLLAVFLREQGYEARSRGTHLWATHANAADPSEERIVLGGAIAAWRREHPDARIAPADFEPPPDKTSRST